MSKELFVCEYCGRTDACKECIEDHEKTCNQNPANRKHVYYTLSSDNKGCRHKEASDAQIENGPACAVKDGE